MLRSLINTNIFDGITKDIVSPSHAYLFYGDDERLNIELSKLFIASIFCGRVACGECEACKQVEINKNPDLIMVDKIGLQVADIEELIDKVQLKPMRYDYKIIFITNADSINETAQNKLLKTLEEPNPHVIFVLACKNIIKLLPTIRSRLKKQFVSPISIDILIDELKSKGYDVAQFSHCDITLTDAVKYSNSENLEIVNLVIDTIKSVKSTADIPNVLSKLKLTGEARTEFLSLMLKACELALNNNKGVFNQEFIGFMQNTFKPSVLIKMLKLIDEASSKLQANVNFNYVLDELFYKILREKYLCK